MLFCEHKDILEPLMIALLENVEQHRDEERSFKSHWLKFKKSFSAG
jgi:hypothetical protein